MPPYTTDRVLFLKEISLETVCHSSHRDRRLRCFSELPFLSYQLESVERPLAGKGALLLRGGPLTVRTVP